MRTVLKQNSIHVVYYIKLMIVGMLNVNLKEMYLYILMRTKSYGLEKY